MISPYVRRLRLAAELRKLRAEVGVTHEELARRIGQSRAQISRLENAHVVDQKDVILILDALDVEGKRWEETMKVAREAGERGWWESHKSMGDRQAFHANLEAGATAICEFQMAILPGLLQTPEYTRARVRSDYVTQGFRLAADAVVEARQLRQRMLYRNRPTYHVILDQVAVTRLAVPPEVAKAQLYHIAALVNASEEYTVQVLPTDAVIEGFAMPRSSFSLYRFQDPEDPAVIVVDTITEDLVRTDESYVQRYDDLFRRLRDAALPPEDSLELLATTAANS